MATTSAKSGTARLGFLQIVVQQGSFKNRGLRSCMDSGINPPDCWGKERSKNNAHYDEPSSHWFIRDGNCNDP